VAGSVPKINILSRGLKKNPDPLEEANVLKVQNLVKNHGSLRVLDGVSLEVTRGEVAVILGASGCGKSTLLRCINGLERFQGGEVRVNELRLGPETEQRPDPDALRALRLRVGMVFQQFNLFPHFSVLENVLTGALYGLGQSRQEAEPVARALLGRVGLADKLHAKPRQLSGGQQQRVAIARALAVKPEAILFDEPTSALDPRMAGEVLGVMADLANSGQTMIVVTHSMSFARNVARTVHVMADGRIAESGSARQVFEDPRHEVTRAFLAQMSAC
jgi:ABC-type polar amino acid transport system ATPase subunit